MLSYRRYLRSIELHPEKDDLEYYPFTVPAIRNLQSIDLNHPVTFFVGENGSGKSTLLEGIAEYCGFDREGGSRNVRFASNDTYGNLSSFSQISKNLKVVWDKRPKDGWYLRAESFFNIANYFDEMAKDDPAAYLPYGGKSLHLMSHGEAFLSLFKHRFSQGLFLLDEPEAALSPQRQLALLRVMLELTKENRNEPSQFIIATHSPILLSFPNAKIYSFDGENIHEIAYEDVPAVQLTKHYLQDPKAFLRHLE